VMVKPFLAEWPLIWTTSWRMLGGLLATVVMVIFTRSENRGLGALKDRAALRVMVPATLIGSCVSLLLWMAGFKYADASVSAALGQTATLYTFVLAVVLLGEPLTSRRVGGLVCGMTGVAFVTFG
jgi:DME family drug/metabolite transporter